MLNAVLTAVARQLQEQQLQARQLVLQQQAASAVAAASKTQREVRRSYATQGVKYTHITGFCSPHLVHTHCLQCCCAAVAGVCLVALPVQVSFSLLHCLCRCCFARQHAQGKLAGVAYTPVHCIIHPIICCLVTHTQVKMSGTNSCCGTLHDGLPSA